MESVRQPYKRFRTRLRSEWLRIVGVYEGLRLGTDFDRVEAFALFLGYPRSGHSLVGSLLDAHPEIVMAHELDALALVEAGLSRRDLYCLIRRNARRFSAVNRQWTGYSYEVDGQWQGRYSRIRIIGDKKGGGSSRHLARRPELLDRLRELCGVPLRMIHVVRNPFDNIASMFLNEDLVRPPYTLDRVIDEYFRLCESVQVTRSRMEPGEFITVEQERLVLCPGETLRTLAEFLGVNVSDAYVEACSDLVFESPHKKRHAVVWRSEHIHQVQDRASSFGFLNHYSFEQ